MDKGTDINVEPYQYEHPVEDDGDEEYEEGYESADDDDEATGRLHSTDW